ncbi:Translin [Crassisporium funariophilum]|nr:Translin [Crassisporium funariophilum]
MSSPPIPHSSVVQLFEHFGADLDDHNDRRERIIKASRDITNISKKVIFLLHRIVLENTNNTDDVALAKRAAQSGYEKLRDVQSLYAKLAVELQGDRYWRYQRQVSPGLQEYIEALSFAHYLDHGSLITFDQVQQTLMDPHGVPYFPLTSSDHLLGLSDLTGELMRFAISGISRRGGRKKASEVCAFVRGCKSDFERMTPYIRDLNKKQAVTTQSLEKIEDAAYAIVVRSSEYDLPPEMLDDIVAQSISNYSSSGVDNGAAFGHDTYHKHPSTGRHRGRDINDDEDDNR